MGFFEVEVVWIVIIVSDCGEYVFEGFVKIMFEFECVKEFLNWWDKFV